MASKFSQEEKLNSANKLKNQVLGTENAGIGIKPYFAEEFPWIPIIPPNKIWSEISVISGATNEIEADLVASLLPTVIEKISVRLTILNTSNNNAYVARSVYNDNSSIVLDNWIQPQLIRTVTGDASLGYSINLYHGNPNFGGVLLPTNFEGLDGEPSWEWSYTTGVLTVAEDENSTYRNFYNTNGLWVIGYRYIGQVGGGVVSGNTSPTPFGVDKSVQFNYNNIILSGDTNFIYDYNNHRIGLGTHTPEKTIHIRKSGDTSAGILIENTTGNTEYNISKISDDIESSAFNFFKTRGSYSGRTIVQINDSLGKIDFWAYTPSSYKKISEIESIYGNFLNSSKLIFKTSTGGFGLPNYLTNRLEITENGTLKAVTPNYETLVINPEDIPNKAYVDNLITVNKYVNTFIGITNNEANYTLTHTLNTTSIFVSVKDTVTNKLLITEITIDNPNQITVTAKTELNKVYEYVVIG